MRLPRPPPAHPMPRKEAPQPGSPKRLSDYHQLIAEPAQIDDQVGRTAVSFAGGVSRGGVRRLGGAGETMYGPVAPTSCDLAPGSHATIKPCQNFKQINICLEAEASLLARGGGED